MARPSVLLIVVDALRADAITPSDTPALSALAEAGASFTEAISPAAWTVPSMASIFSGVGVPVHKVERYRPQERVAGDFLSLAWDTLPERFAAVGYQTVGLKKSTVLDPKRGFAQGFATFRVVGGDMAEGQSALQLTDEALRWSDRERKGDRPFFLYLHYMDPHSSYRPPADWMAAHAERFLDPSYVGPIDGDHKRLEERLRDGPLTEADRAQLKGLYRAEVAWWDEQFGRLLAGMKERGLLEDTLVVVVADHGEALGEHGAYFEGGLYQENVHVPWIMAGPGVTPEGERGRKITAYTSLLDLAPTLVDACRLTPGEGWQGVSRWPDVQGRPTPPSPVFAWHDRQQLLVRPDGVAAYLRPDTLSVFSLLTDPSQLHDLAGYRLRLGRQLYRQLLARQEADARRASGVPHLE